MNGVEIWRNIGGEGESEPVKRADTNGNILAASYCEWPVEEQGGQKKKNWQQNLLFLKTKAYIKIFCTFPLIVTKFVFKLQHKIKLKKKKEKRKLLCTKIYMISGLNKL